MCRYSLGEISASVTSHTFSPGKPLVLPGCYPPTSQAGFLRLVTGGILICPIGWLGKFVITKSTIVQNQLYVWTIGTEGPTCLHILIAAGWCGAFALISNSSLSLFRLLAVFGRSWKIKAMFGFLWMSSFLALVTPPTTPYSKRILTCEFSEVTHVILSCFILVTVFDSLVFLAVFMRLLRINQETIAGKHLLSFLFGDGLGHTSRILLRTGQAYYLCVYFNHIDFF